MPQPRLAPLRGQRDIALAPVATTNNPSPMSSSFAVADKVVIITGAGQGIGRISSVSTTMARPLPDAISRSTA